MPIGIGIGEIVFAAFIVVTLIQLFYYLGIFSRFAFRKEKSFDTASKQESVSIVICSKNEAENLQKNIPLFFAQDYPDFQVVVVNDCSVDESEDILDEFKKNMRTCMWLH